MTTLTIRLQQAEDRIVIKEVTTGGGGGSGASVGSAAPQALGSTALPGTSGLAARQDHVHPYPTASQVGAIASSLIDAKGDLIAGTSDNNVARMGVGSNGQVLMADSTQTTGMKWASPFTVPLSVELGGTGSTDRNFVDLTSTESITGTKTFVASPKVPTPSSASDAASKSYVDGAISDAAPDLPWAIEDGGTGSSTKSFVDLTTAQAVAGVKTFSDSPVVPDPTTDGQAANRGWTLAALEDYAETTYVDSSISSAVSGLQTDIETAAGAAQAAAEGYADLVALDNFIDVTKAPYNADRTGATFAAEAIQDAIDFMEAAGGGTVYAPRGVYLIDETIQQKMKVRFVGDGHWTTVLKAAAGFEGHVIQNKVSADGIEANGAFTILEDMCIDGEGQADGEYYGIFHDMNPHYAWATNDIEYDPHHIVRNVMIINTASDGYHGEGRSESYLDRVFAFKCGRHGIHPSFDTFLNHCTSAWSQANGFNVIDSSIRGTGCKAFWNGRGTVDGSNGHGFFFGNGQGGINFFGSNESQDNAGCGIALNNCNRAQISMICDTNSNGHVNSEDSGSGWWPAVDLWDSHHNQLEIVAYERRAYDETSYQLHGLQIRQNSSNNTINLKHSATTYNGAEVGAAVMTTSNALWGNEIVINNMNGSQSVAGSGTITPNPYNGGTVYVPLSGNVTVNDPDTDNRHIGCKVRFVFLQTVGGSTVTWGSGYAPSGWTVNSTINESSAIEFLWNGSKWVRCS